MSSVYISGPMTGQPDSNYAAFDELAANLHEQGYSVLNPAANFGGDPYRPRSDYMRLDIAHVLEADSVMVLPAWETSRGSRLEVTVALELGLKIYDTEWNEITSDARAFLETGYKVWKPADGEFDAPNIGTARTFDTGATRDTDDGKLDYEGFLSPLVIKRFAEYMHECRRQSDGKLRASDNWQKGIPQDVYMKSIWRHFMDVWLSHRDRPHHQDTEAELCALLFNVMGMLHEELK